MKQKRTYITLVLIIALLCLGIAYAAVIGNISLNIGGTVSASPDGANFVVKFAENPTASATRGSATASKTNDTNAKLEVTGLTAAGDSATAIFTVVNESPDLLANLSVATSAITDDVADKEYFEITTDIEEEETAIAAENGTKKVTVTVTLVQTPVDADVTGTINIELTAEPVQP